MCNYKYSAEQEQYKPSTLCNYRYSAERTQYKPKKDDDEATPQEGATPYDAPMSVSPDNSQDSGTVPMTRANTLFMELEKQREFLETGDDSKRLLTTPPTSTPEGYSSSDLQDPLQDTSMYCNTSHNDAQLRYPSSYIPHPTAHNTTTGPPSKKPRLLPWWSIYIGYVVALWIVGVAFWLTVEVAGVFGLQKSKKWLTSFTIAIVESIFFSQPIKVLFYVTYYIIINITEQVYLKH